MTFMWTGWKESWKVMEQNLIRAWICIPHSRGSSFPLLRRGRDSHRVSSFFFSRHVMLRDGLISPRSKVITALDTSNRPGSTVSASKSYIIFLLKENSHLVLF